MFFYYGVNMKKQKSKKKKDSRENLKFCMRYLCENCPHRKKCKL